MSIIDFVRNRKVRNFINLTLFLTAILFFIYLFYKNKYVTPEQNQQQCERLKKQEFRGVVINSFKDYNNHGLFMLEIKTEFDTLKYPCLYFGDLDMYIDNGDSIHKVSDEFRILVFKKKNIRDSVVVVESKKVCN